VTEITDCVFDKANLSAAILDGAILLRSRMRSCHALGASFAVVYAEDADFGGSDFAGSDFSGAILSRANLAGSRFDAATIGGVLFEGCNARGASFRRTNYLMDRRPFDVSDYRTGYFVNRQPLPSQIAPSFVGADLHSADFTGANLRDADFTRACLRNVVFTDSNVTTWTLDEADTTDSVDLRR